MEQRELTIRRREGTGKSVAKRLRRRGQVPAILYGGSSPLPITVDPREFLRMIHGREGSTQLLSLILDAHGQPLITIIRDMHFVPVSESLMHVDLQADSMDHTITF